MSTGAAISVAALLLLVAGCADRSAGCEPVLAIERWPAGERLAMVAPGPEGSFRLSFRHSVSLGEVIDLYRLDGGEIRQVGAVFDSHGAGLPSTLADGAIRIEDGRFRLSVDRVVEPLILRPRAEYENKLVAAEVIDLTEWHGAALRLRAIGCDGGGTGK